MTNKNKKKKNKKSFAFRVIKYTIILLILSVFILAGAAFGMISSIISEAPELDPEKFRPAQTSFVFNETGEIEVAQLHGEQNRKYIKLENIPDHLKQAVISIEDERFYEHFGVDLKGTLKAVYLTIRNRSLSGPGGSTITQQLIKNTMLSQEKRIDRKIQEMWLAIQAERRYTKDQILEFYLNEIYFGHSAYGVQAAARVYFDKDVKDLTLAESAMIAGITNNPAAFSPYLNFDRSKERQHIILNVMVRNGYITQEEADQAKAEEIKLAGLRSQYRYPYFVDHVIRETLQHLRDLGYSNEEATNLLYRGGLRIYTTINIPIQEKAEEVFANSRMFPRGTVDDKGLAQPQGAVSVLDHHTGAIVALVGGRDHHGRLTLNRATQSKRQPGSAIKPITVYTPAMEVGLRPSTVVDDAPMEVPQWDGSLWKPENYNRRFRGLTNLRESVMWSINTSAVKVGLDLGIDRMFDYGVSMGLKSLVATGRNNDKQMSPMTLGGLTFGVSPLELTSAYGTIANGGIYIEPYVVTKITDSNGRVIYQHRPKKTVVLKEETSFFMISMLQDVISRGTGTNARFGWPAGGKTGTTDRRHDVWFVGFTPKYSASVWIGHDQPAPMDGAWGGTFAAPIWREIMKVAHEGMAIEQFPVPKNIISVDICKISGKLPTELCSHDPRGSQVYREYFVRGTQPLEYCDVHVKLEVNKQNGKLATPYCPPELVESRIFVNRPPFMATEDGRVPEDARYMPPTEYCTDHGPGSFYPPVNGSNNDDTDQNNGNGGTNGENINNGTNDNTGYDSNGNNGNAGNGGNNGSGNNDKPVTGDNGLESRT